VVKAAEEGQGDDAAMIRWLDRARFGRVLVESEVRARGVVVAEVAAQTLSQVSLVEDDDVVEDLAADVTLPLADAQKLVTDLETFWRRKKGPHLIC